MLAQVHGEQQENGSAGASAASVPASSAALP